MAIKLSWKNEIFNVGDRVVSLIYGDRFKKGTVAEINRRSPEKFIPFDDLIVQWDDGIKDCLYFDQVGKIEE